MNSNKIPAITVIIPVYNVEKYLHQCIESIINQRFTDFELLLIDDGSTDNSPDICDYFQSKDMRIKTFHKKNGGVSSARNLGIQEARGKWICFIDADDWVGTKYLEELYEAVDSDNLLIVQGFNRLDNHKKLPVTLDFGNLTVSSKSYFELFSVKELHRYGYPYAKLYNRKVVIDNNIHFDIDIVCIEDAIFMYEYLLKTKTVKFIEGTNYFYRAYSCGLHFKVPPYTSARKLYIRFKNLIDQMNKINESNYDFIELKQALASVLMQLILGNYRYGNVMCKTDRLTILNKLRPTDLRLLEEYFKIPRKYYKAILYLIKTKNYKTLDYALLLIFKIHFIITRRP